MEPMIPSHQLLAQRIRDELEELERAVRRVERVWQAAQRVQADQDVYVDSAALNLHGFYAGLERLFESVAHRLDDGPPKGQAWHQELLRQMATEVSGTRPEVISRESAIGLDEFRSFRHVVRNVYADHLDPERIGRLVGKLPALWERLKAELLEFAQFLEGVSWADDEVEK